MNWRKTLVAGAIALASAIGLWVAGAIFNGTYDNSRTLANPSGSGGLAIATGILYIVAIAATVVAIVFAIGALAQWAKESDKS